MSYEESDGATCNENKHMQKSYFAEVSDIFGEIHLIKFIFHTEITFAEQGEVRAHARLVQPPSRASMWR